MRIGGGFDFLFIVIDFPIQVVEELIALVLCVVVNVLFKQIGTRALGTTKTSIHVVFFLEIQRRYVYGIRIERTCTPKASRIGVHLVCIEFQFQFFQFFIDVLFLVILYKYYFNKNLIIIQQLTLIKISRCDYFEFQPASD